MSTELIRATLAAVERLRARAVILNRTGDAGLASWLNNEAARLEAAALITQGDERRRAEEAASARLHTRGGPL